MVTLTSLDPTQNAPSSLAGKVILITGGTSGLGAASALALARLGPSRIYISGRRSSAAAAIIAQIETLSSNTVSALFLPCDLADLSSVNAAAEHILKHESRLDVLLANAGVAAVAPGRTKDGYEVHFGTNHVGHALLVRKLLPLLQAAEGRVVSLTSFSFRAAIWGIPFDKVRSEGNEGIGMGDYLMIWRWMRYAESKLANVVYARELAKRYPEVLSVSVSPGFVETEMVSGMRLCDRLGTRALGYLAGGMVKPEEGALNQIWAATAERGELTNGAVYEPVGVVCANMGGPATDQRVGDQLWEWTEKELSSWL